MAGSIIYHSIVYIWRSYSSRYLMNSNRLDTLDSFRFLAIFSVLLFHFYSRWTPPLNPVSLYPYGSRFDFFPYAKYGVEFFFTISGFVITYTLSATRSIGDFWKKRFIRLFPAMLLASLVTYLAFLLFDNNRILPDCHSFINIFYSLTFLSPQLLNSLLQPFGISGAYLNGSYWSLWPEIQFYFLVSTVYFLNRKHFIRNFSMVVMGICAIRWLMGNLQTSNKLHLHLHQSVFDWYNYWIGEVFNLPTYLLWFYNGVLFHELFFKKAGFQVFIFLAVSIFLTFYMNQIRELVLSNIPILLFFGLFLLRPGIFSGGVFRVFNKIGVASYFLYLIHEALGVLLINKLAILMGGFSYLFPVLLIVGFPALSVWLYRIYEKPVGAWLRSVMY